MLIPDTRIQQTKIGSGSIMLLFISTMSLLDHGASEEPKMWKAKDGKQKKHVLLKVEKKFSTVKTLSSNQTVLDENPQRTTPLNMSLWNKT